MILLNDFLVMAADVKLFDIFFYDFLVGCVINTIFGWFVCVKFFHEEFPFWGYLLFGFGGSLLGTVLTLIIPFLGIIVVSFVVRILCTALIIYVFLRIKGYR